ncbi:TadE/TadG family type IV pilus assembly protein [Rhizobium sp. C4]|uniref:TadE/TadG family type IV pilus assembly protein n=1 Tax=Rhizobium sp. C4 TaxID=1349800 RepID=UPI001E5F852C|nr:TadE/TadG family type IV pilus assembly protein [Rhizobium sp. C4]MCD2174558.1 pilus assembly protein [Rhizobium sp. C4]
MRFGVAARGLLKRRDGAAAVEFAVVFPLFVLVIFGGLAFGMAMLNLNALQSVATQGARCIAISGSSCTTAVAGCTDTPQQCYIEQLAVKQGLVRLKANHITIIPTYLVGVASFTRVQITYPMSVAGYSFSISATAQFPNG